MTPMNPVDRLVTLLQDERTALLQADFTALEAIAMAKDTCLSRLQEYDLAPPTLAHLRQLGARNQSLLDAALQGLESAKRTLSALSAARVTRTYGPDGRQSALFGPLQNLSHKI